MAKNIFQKVKEQLKKHEWIEEECYISFHILDHWCVCYPSIIKGYNISNFSIVIYYLINNYGHEESSIREARKGFEFIFQEMLKNPRYLDKKFREFIKVVIQIENIFSLVKNGIKKVAIGILFMIML